MECKVAQCEKGIAIANQISVSIQQQTMTIMEKLGILTDAAKYDVACTSSGVDRRGNGKGWEIAL